MQQLAGHTFVGKRILSRLDQEAGQAIRQKQTEANTICNQGDGDGRSLIRCTKRG